MSYAQFSMLRRKLPNPFRYGLRAYVGENGSGKSLMATAEVVVPAFAMGYPVVSNIALRPEEMGCDPDLFIPLESWRQIPLLGRQKNPADSLTGNRPCVLLLDEITSCLPARQTLNVPPELLRVLDQFRKQQTAVVVTAPNFMKIDKFLRSNIQLVTVCAGRWPDKWLREDGGKKLKGAEGKALRWEGPWPPYRMFTTLEYRGVDFEDFNYDTMQKIGAVGHSWYWRTAPWNKAHRVYDTREAVHLLDLVDAGYCVHCGKKTRTELCDGKHSPVRAPRPAAVAVAR